MTTTCPECSHPFSDAEDTASPCSEADCECDGVCNDCGAALTYTDDDEWQHRDAEARARGCFLIAAVA